MIDTKKTRKFIPLEARLSNAKSAKTPGFLPLTGFILPTSITDGLKRLFFLLCFGGRSALFLLLAALDGGFDCSNVHDRRLYRFVFGDRYHRNHLVLVDRNFGRLREYKVGHFNLVFQSDEFRNIDADSAREFGRLALNFNFVYNLGQNTAELLDRRRNAVEFQRHGDGNLLALFDSVKVGMHERARNRVHINLLYQRALIGIESGQRDYAGCAGCLIYFFKIFVVYGNRSRLLRTAVDNRGQNAFLAEAFGRFIYFALSYRQFHCPHNIPKKPYESNYLL